MVAASLLTPVAGERRKHLGVKQLRSGTSPWRVYAPGGRV